MSLEQIEESFSVSEISSVTTDDMHETPFITFPWECDFCKKFEECILESYPQGEYIVCTKCDIIMQIQIQKNK